VILWPYPDTGRTPLQLATEHRNNIFGVQLLPGSGNAQVVTCAGDGTVQLHQLGAAPSFRLPRGAAANPAGGALPALAASPLADPAVARPVTPAGAPPPAARRALIVRLRQRRAACPPARSCQRRPQAAQGRRRQLAAAGAGAAPDERIRLPQRPSQGAPLPGGACLLRSAHCRAPAAAGLAARTLAPATAWRLH
jgi:hypothetical protein